MASTVLHIALPGSQGGDEHQLFTDLFRTYGARIFFYFKKYVKRDEMAEDLLQEVFASLWAKRDSLVKEKNIEGYLFVSARNQLYNHLRQSVGQTTAVLQEDLLASSYLHVEENISYKEVKTTYYKVLATLPAQRRKAFILSREHGFSYQEIAQQMGISPRTVEKHISEALQSLRGEMGVSYAICFLFIIT